MANLTKESADALCTVITFGFFSMEGYKVILQSEPPKEINPKEKDTASKIEEARKEAAKEATDYQQIVNAYQPIAGKGLLCDQSFKQEHMPYVLAKTLDDMEGLKPSEALIKVIPIIKELFDKAKEVPNHPYGAYIGGILAKDKFTIVGPSGLSQYKPNHRKITTEEQDEIKSSYKRAKEATNSSWDIINKLPENITSEENPPQGK